MARKSEADVPEVSAQMSSAGPEDTSAPSRRTPSKRAVEARAKNLDPGSKRPRREQRDSFRRAAERESAAFLKSVGLQKHPAARRIARRLTDHETEISRLRDRIDHRGRIRKDGSLSAAYMRYLELIGRDLSESKRMLEAVAGLGGRTEPLQLTYVAVFGDPEVDGTAASADSLAGLRLADEAMAGPLEPDPARGPLDAPESAPARDGAQQVPATVRELVQEAEPEKRLPDGARTHNGEPAPHPGNCLCARCRYNRCDFLDD